MSEWEWGGERGGIRKGKVCGGVGWRTAIDAGCAWRVGGISGARSRGAWWRTRSGGEARFLRFGDEGGALGFVGGREDGLRWYWAVVGWGGGVTGFAVWREGRGVFVS